MDQVRNGCADFWFTYKTPKLVSVRDQKLGVLFNFLQLSVIGYLAIYICGYQCKHLVAQKAEGLTRLTIQQPTKACNPLKNTCDSNYTDAARLPYCTQYQGDQTVSEKHQFECMFHDGIDISYEIPVPGTLFATTRYSEFKQKRECKPTAPDYGCRGQLYRGSEGAGDYGEKTFYMADIERFTLLFGHGFEANDGSGKILKGQGAELDGYIKAGGQGSSAKSYNMKDSPLGSVFRIKHLGDVISIGDLLRLTSPDMDVTLDSINEDNGMPLRYNGLVILVHITYTNRQNFDIFGQTTPYYLMTAQKLEISEFKKMYRYDKHWAYVDERLVSDNHGVLVVTKLGGDIMFFQWLHLFQVLTTAVGFLAVARILSDFVMAHLHAHKEKYNLLKYQRVKDFNMQHIQDPGDAPNHTLHPYAKLQDLHDTLKSVDSELLRNAAKDSSTVEHSELLHRVLKKCAD
jgi:hypothetical protein